MGETGVVVRDGSNEYTAPDIETVRQWRHDNRIGPNAIILDGRGEWVGLSSIEAPAQRGGNQRRRSRTLLLLVVLIPVIGVGSCVAFGVGGVLFMGVKDARLKPHLPQRFAEADALAQAGKWPDAKERYDDLVDDLTFTSLSSYRARALAGQAVCLAMLGQDREAQQVFERAFELDPALPTPSSGAAVAPFMKLHSTAILAAENEYLLAVHAPVAGAVATTLALAQKVDRTDLRALVAEYGAARVTDQLVKEVTRGREVSTYYCSKYKPSAVPARFRDADAQVKAGCTALTLAYSRLIDSTKAIDPDGIENGWQGLNHAIGQLKASLSVLTPIIEARGIEVAGAAATLAAGIPKQEVETVEAPDEESWREYGRTRKYGRQIERETKAWRALIAENKPGLSAAEHERLIERQNEYVDRIRKLREADYKAWVADNQ